MIETKTIVIMITTNSDKTAKEIMDKLNELPLKWGDTSSDVHDADILMISPAIVEQTHIG